MSRHAEMSTQFKARVDLPRGDVSVSERGWRLRVSGEVLGLCAVEYEFEGLLLDLHPSMLEIGNPLGHRARTRGERAPEEPRARPSSLQLRLRPSVALSTPRRVQQSERYGSCGFCVTIQYTDAGYLYSHMLTCKTPEHETRRGLPDAFIRTTLTCHPLYFDAQTQDRLAGL
jgi:hypothetical protein